MDTDDFRFADVTDVYDANFLPGSVKYGDFPGLLALAAPTKLRLVGEGGEPPRIVRAAYESSNSMDQLIVPARVPADAMRSTVDWLLEE